MQEERLIENNALRVRRLRYQTLLESCRGQDSGVGVSKEGSSMSTQNQPIYTQSIVFLTIVQTMQ